MPATAEPPVAPAAPPPTAPPVTPPSTTNLTEPSTVPVTPPKPGSARERMQKAAEKNFKVDDTAPTTPEAPKPANTPKPDAPKGDEPPVEKAEVPTDVTPEQKKQNPWKLYKAEKARAESLERQIAEGKSSSLAETEKAQYEERITKAEEKLKGYEDEIRFKAYEKSDEFKTKYEQPYEKAWSKHMHDLRGVTVLDDAGAARPMEAKDILDLVNLELPDARKLATEKFGDFAQDAMAARKEIRDLFEAKNTALDEARKTGADREKAFEENRKKWVEGVQKHIRETWEAANQTALKDANNGEFFKPVEGDDTRNQLLGKGYALVDEAFGKNPTDPNLTPEQREKLVRQHAAVRNRAAAFGPMKYLINRLQKEIAELKKANGEFKGSEPPRAGGTQANGAPASTSARDRMRAAGEKWAK